MKKVGIILVMIAFAGSMSAQKYFTKSGKISFHSDAPMEKIEAENNTATCVFDTESGAMEWAVLIKAFKFEKALMEEHFNENYMESSEFPKAKFKGTIKNIGDLDLAVEGEYKTTVAGTLEIHGVKKEIETPVVFVVSGGEISASCAMNVLVKDFDIEVPSVVAKNIAEEVQINIHANYQELAKK